MSDTDEVHELTNKSVIKAMALLTQLGGCPQGATMTELSQQLGMSRPTVFRLLLSLAQTGFVEKVENKYRLGWKMARLGRLADPHGGLIARVQPLLVDLAEQLNEMIGYAVANGGTDFDYVAEALAPRLMTLQGYIGREFPIHASATGKVVLAELGDDKIRALLPKNLQRMTSRTIVDRGELIRTLHDVRRQQYAIVDDELEESLFAVAVPVRASSRRLIGVLSVTAPSPRIKGRPLSEIVNQLRQTAAVIGDVLAESHSVAA